MIIINQDKDVIVNIKNAKYIDIVTDLDGTGKLPQEIYCDFESERVRLGTYDTEKKSKRSITRNN